MVAVGTACILAFGFVVFWHLLHRDRQQQIARIVDDESYAARSQLSRDIEQQLNALREVARFWEQYGRLPRDQWKSDAKIELSHFEGIRSIVWNDPAKDVHYVATPDRFAFDRRPSDAQWTSISQMLRGIPTASGEAVYGPVPDDDGHLSYRVCIGIGQDARDGMLVALVDAHDLLASLLRDQSPGYSISILWHGQKLFQRGEPANGMPTAWQRRGFIKLSMGPIWEMVHTPDATLAARFRTPALTAMLPAGLLISMLVGALIFQNQRVRSRARVAEHAQRRFAALNDELEQQVASRTKELALRSADLETIGESVTHDLRNPLNVISLNVHLESSRSTAEGEAISEPLQQIDKAAKQIAHILDRLRSFSAVSYAVFDRTTIDMADLARGVFEELAFAEPPPHATFHVGALPRCQGDRKLVEILLMNLLSNALKYTRYCAQREIEMGFQPSTVPTVYYVRDNGMGFDSRQAERLFEPFRRLEQAEDVDGQGVGLAIAARIVHRHGGRIWAEADAGRGATFYFELGPASTPASETVAE